MPLAEDFEQATKDVKTFTSRPDNDTLLQLYGLYKQATEGDNRSSQPWAVQVEARAKWDAWTKQKGKGADAAKKDYVDLVKKLKG